MAQSWLRTATLVVMCGAAALPGMAADSPTTPPRQTELLALVAANSQQISAPDPQTGTITGTVTDVNGDAVPGATIVLEGPSGGDHSTVVANENGFFQLKNLDPGIPYHIAVTANGFANWTSPDNIILKPGQVLDLPGVNLQIATVVTTVVALSSEQAATEQVKVEETQRVLGVFPNFYVVYDHNAVPLTSKLKFQLALRASVDPVTFLGVGVLAAADQAADTPKYVQGVKGYGERVGATYTDGFTDILIGGAILPSLLHQDPRYFYQGTGTTKSRILHALSSPFICKGDNGRWQPNYSSVGGDLASGAIANLYYPASNRGVRLVFGNALITTGGRMVNGLVQEFFLRKFTHNIKSNSSN
jgi:hypothetical protein